MRRRPPQDGQTLVELVALLPALMLIGLLGWQMVVAGYAWTVAAGAARAGARAAEVGAPPREAALAVLPRGYARAAVVTSTGSGVRVRLRVAPVLAWLPGPGYVAAGAGERR